MANINYTSNVYAQGMGWQGNYPDAETGTDAGPDTGPGRSPDEQTSVGAAVNILGGLASLALIVGVGVWGYKLMVRDVSGVPVVRALAGPMRIQPDNPGGLQADHQGLSVNAVAAQGTAEPTADRLMLAPPPVELAEEDKPLDQIKPQPASLSVPEQMIAPDTKGATGSVLTSDDTDALVVAALVEQLTAGVEPISGTTTETNNANTTSSGTADSALPSNPPEIVKSEDPDASPAPTPDMMVHKAVLTGPGLPHSLRPLARPARTVSSGADQSTDPTLASAISAAVETVASLDVNPDSLPVGTRLAQLGAYDSADIARSEWDRMNVRFEEFMQGKQRVIQKATSGGRTFYRLRAMGFADLNEARRFCSALVSENADCIPVTTR